MSQTLVRISHDKFVKKVIGNKMAAKDFLQEHLPDTIKRKLDLDSIKIESTSYIEPHLKEKSSDVLYSVKTKKGKSAFIYTAIEHQSTVDHLISLRILKYNLLILEKHEKEVGNLPIIYNLVIYNGTKKYNAATNICQLFSDHEAAKEMITGDYQLINLHADSDDEIIKRKKLVMFEYFLKHIRHRDILKLFVKFFEENHELILVDKEQNYLYIKPLLWYIDSRLPADKKEEFNRLIIDVLPDKDGEIVMESIADTYVKEGINKGILIGKAEGKAEGKADGLRQAAIRMLKENADIDFVSKVTGFPLNEILKLKNSN